MTTRTASLRLQLIDAVSGPAKGASGSLRGIDSALARLGKGSTPQVQRLVKQLEHLQKKSGAITTFTDSRRGLKEMGVELKMARSNVDRLRDALNSATKPTAKMKTELESAKAALRSTVQSFRQQVDASRQAERALRSYGINGRNAISGSQKAIRDEIARTIREMRRLDQESRRPKPPRQLPPSQRPPGGGSPAYDAVTAVGGGVLANAGRNTAQRSFFLGVDFDRAAAYQAALGDLNQDDRSKLNNQAERIGGATRFSNVDVVQAQTTVLQRGIRDTNMIMDLTDKITDYALAMGVTLEEGVEAVTGSALSKRIDLADTKAIGNFVDFMVWMAKNGGLSNEDVSQFVKYGGAPTTGAKLPDEYMAAMAMILRRSNVRGDEAGVFARAASSKLVAPTQKGRDALAAMGIDFSKFTAIDAMNTDGIGIMMKNKFGLRLDDAMKEAVAELINNGEYMDPETGTMQSVISDSGEFVTQMSRILGPLFHAEGKKMSALDAAKLAKALGDYQKYSVDSVDTKGLMDALAAANPGIGNLNAFFTDRQGGRAHMIFSQWAEFQRMLGLMQNVPGGVANKIGVAANEGIYGDWTKLTGTVETALTRISQDWEFATRPLINKTNEVIDGFTGLSENTRRLVEVFGAAVAVFAGMAAFRAGTGLLGRMIGGGGAGTAAAANPVAAGAAGWLARTGGLLGIGTAGLLTSQTLGMGSRGTPEQESKMKQMIEEQVARNKAKAGATTSAGAAPLMEQMQSATSSWPFTAQQAMQEYVRALATGGDQAEAEAAAIGDEIKAKLTVTAHPDVNTGRLERALGLARQLASALGGSSGTSAASTPTNTLKFGGPRKKGGSVKKGHTYLVGEDGPEPFTPGANGHISPNSALGGEQRVVISMPVNIHLNGGATKRDAETIVSELGRLLGRAEQTAFGGLRYGDK